MLTQASAAPPAAHSGPSPSPLDFAYDFGALAQDRQEARQATAVEHATASGRYTGSNLDSSISGFYARMHSGCCCY